MKLSKIFGLLILVLVLLQSGVFAQTDNTQKNDQAKPMNHAGMMPAHRGMGMMPALNLTEDQKAKFQQFNLDNQKEMIKLRSEIELKQVELKKILAEKELNTNSYSKLNKEITELEGKIKEKNTENWLKIYNLLDEKQRPIFKNQLGRNRMMMGQGRMQGFGRGMNMRPGGMGMRDGRMGMGMGMREGRPAMGGDRMGMRPGMMGMQPERGMMQRGEMRGNMMMNRGQGRNDKTVEKEVILEKK